MIFCRDKNVGKETGDHYLNQFPDDLTIILFQNQNEKSGKIKNDCQQTPSWKKTGRLSMISSEKIESASLR